MNVNLNGTDVTDEGLVHLKGLTKLETLGLGRTQVTDAGLVHLKGMTNLKRLYLHYTQVTAAGVAELKKALPKCLIGFACCSVEKTENRKQLINKTWEKTVVNAPCCE